MSEAVLYGQYAVRWIGVFFVGAGLAFPIVSRLCKTLPRDGAGFAFPIALAVVTGVTFLVGQFAFGPLAIAAGVVSLLVAAVRFRAAADQWRSLGEAGLVFLFGFLFVTGLQYFHVGVVPLHEHFLNYAVFNALQNAASLPPEDVWFAGEPLRYYYGGHLGAVVAATLTDTPSEYAFPLALSSYFGLLLVAVYELGGSIAVRRGQSYRAAGSLSVFFVGFAGNLFLPLVVVLEFLPSPVVDHVFRAVATGFTDGTRDTLRHGLESFTYWDAFFTLEEGFSPFPLYLWLHGELHAHMMSAPFLVAFAGLLLSYYRTEEAAHTRRRLLLFGAVPVTVGFLTTVELWSLPTSLGLVFLTVLFAPARPTPLFPPADWWRRRAVADTTAIRRESLRYGSSLIAVGGVAAATLVVASPFLLGMSGGSQNHVRLVRAGQRTALPPLLTVHGLFLLATGTALVRIRHVVARPIHRWGIAGITALAVILAATQSAVPAAIVLVPVLLLPWYALRTSERRSFAYVLVVAAVGLVLLTDVVYIEVVEDILTGRVNTVFKFYMHAWLFWGVASGVFVSALLAAVRSPVRGSAIRRAGPALVVAFLLVSGSMYGVVATEQHVERATTSEPIDDATPIPAALASAYEPRTYDDSRFFAGDHTVRAGGSIVASTRRAPPGELLWSGPYVGLLPGEYVANFHLNVTSNSSEPVVIVDVVAGGADRATMYRSFGERTVGAGDDDRVVSVPFEFVRTMKDVEFRGRAAGGNGTVELDHVSVESVGGQPTPRVENLSGPAFDADRFGKAIHPDEYNAAMWLEDEASGRPTIATAPGGRWQWGSAFSVYTGFPTVVGWAHEMGYHGREAYQERLEDVDALYVGTPAERASILATYGVEYVVVGPQERDRYSEIRPFSELRGVSLAYEENGVSIYAVDHTGSRPATAEADGYEIDGYYHPAAAAFETAAVSEWNTERTAIVAANGTGVAWYGPWVRLHPGTYEITYSVNVSNGGRSPAAALEVRSGTTDLHGEETVLANRTVTESNGTRNVTAQFTVDQTRRAVEFRGYILDPNATLELHGIEVVRLDGADQTSTDYSGSDLSSRRITRLETPATRRSESNP